MEFVVTGLFIGLIFGFVLQRGRFCMNSAFRDMVVLKDNVLLKTVFVALLVELVGFRRRGRVDKAHLLGYVVGVEITPVNHE